jgi:hypothetical protein
MAVVIGGSVAPEPFMVEAELYVPLLGWGDKFLHFVGYFGLAFFAMSSFERRSRGMAAALSMIALGAGVEFAQMLSPTRTPDWTDAIANTAGVVCGMTMVTAVAKLAARQQVTTAMEPAAATVDRPRSAGSVRRRA